MTSTMRFDKWENSLGQPYGAVLQVVQVVKTDVYAVTTSALWMSVPGLSVNITPKFSNSKILVLVDLKGVGTPSASIIRSRLLRDGSPIYVGDASGLRPQSLSQHYGGNTGSDGNHYTIGQLGGTFLDSPGTAGVVTYSIQVGGDGASGNVIHVNRTQTDRNAAGIDSRMPSSITLMEIAQ
jgi:hypothetical protein